MTSLVVSPIYAAQLRHANSLLLLAFSEPDGVRRKVRTGGSNNFNFKNQLITICLIYMKRLQKQDKE